MASYKTVTYKKGRKSQHVVNDVAELGGKHRDVDYKEAHSALKKAFDDLKDKYSNATSEISRLKTRLNRQNAPSQPPRDYPPLTTRLQHEHQINLNAELKQQQTQLHMAEKEIEELQDKLSKSFIAYQEKYQECVKLKSTFEEYQHTMWEGANSKKDCQTEQQEQATSEVQLPQKAGSTLKTTETQTILEKRTDDVTSVIDDWASFLSYYGLETVTEEGKAFLIITERDVFNGWVTEFTGGKGCVTFPLNATVQEIGIQTDDWEVLNQSRESIEELKERCSSYEYKISLLKQKVTDQADELQRLHDIIESLHGKVQATNMKESQDADTASVHHANETELAEKRKKRLQQLVFNITSVINDTRRLQAQLMGQKTHIRHLVEIINKAKGARLTMMSRLASQRGRDIADEPEHAGVIGAHSNVAGAHSNVAGAHSNVAGAHSNVAGAHSNVAGTLSNVAEGNSNVAEGNSNVTGEFPALSVSLTDTPISMPVQETDIRFLQRQPRKRQSTRNRSIELEDARYDIGEAHLSRRLGERLPSGSNFELKSPLSTRNIPASEFGFSSTQPNNDADYSGLTGYTPVMTNSPPGSASDYPPQPPMADIHYNDDIIVIEDENEAAIGGATGEVLVQGVDDMMCPMCPMIFAPGTTQINFELHVEGHFNES